MVTHFDLVQSGDTPHYFVTGKVTIYLQEYRKAGVILKRSPISKLLREKFE